MTVKDLLSEYFTEEDVCQVLGIVLVTLRTNRCNDSDHPTFIRRGRMVLYPKEEFATWFRGGKKAPQRPLLRVK